MQKTWLAAALCAALSLTGCRAANAVLSTAVNLAGTALQAKLMMSCVPEGAEIDTPTGPRAIETIAPGDWVVGYDGASVRVMQKHAYLEPHANDRFLAVEFASGATVYVCDTHRIAGQRAMDCEPGQEVAGGTVVAIGPAPFPVVRSYDLLTEDRGYRMAGVPINSMIEEMQATMRSLATTRASRR